VATRDLQELEALQRQLAAAAGEAWPWRPAMPGTRRGDRAALRVGDELVGYSLRARDGVRPICVSAGWRTDAETAVAVTLAVHAGERTPAPLREARRRARAARSRDALARR
jgi:deoxyribonuclease V